MSKNDGLLMSDETYYLATTKRSLKKIVHFVCDGLSRLDIVVHRIEKTVKCRKFALKSHQNQ
jgi:hypothetical protein